jgi:flagellar hook assembly protein FlgD
VKVEIYDALGRRVRLLVDQEMSAGYQTAIWDGKSDHGISLSSGIYFYRLHTPYFTRARKLMLLQ